MKQEIHVLSEGGAFGHLSNLFDLDLTQDELIKIIKDSLRFKFDTVEIKTDAINLMFTVRSDGVVVGGRNKSTTKNFGFNGLTVDSIYNKFKGRSIAKDYSESLKDLQSAINKLSKKDIKDIFNDGHNWMSIEVISKTAKNIIDYDGLVELRLHGTIEFDKDGNKIGQINKDNSNKLDALLGKINAKEQKTFTIKKLSIPVFKRLQSLVGIENKLISDTKKILQRRSILEYKIYKISKYIEKYTDDDTLKTLLLNRWIHFDKSITITAIYKLYPDSKDWIKTVDKAIPDIIKDIMIPLEKVVLKLGSVVIEQMTAFMSKDPNKTVLDLKKQLSDAIDKLSASNDTKLLSKLKLELDRLNSTGGQISPTEGITFFINTTKGRKFVKLTGNFAALNQIIGLTYRI